MLEGMINPVLYTVKLFRFSSPYSLEVNYRINTLKQMLQKELKSAGIALNLVKHLNIQISH